MSKSKLHQIEHRPIDELTPYARNSRTHSDDQVAQIAASINEFGFTNPVIVDEDGMIIAGHGRVMAAKKLNLETVPCVQVSGWSQEQKRAYVIADNKLALNAGWDAEMLNVELRELKEADFDIDLIGFSEAELADIIFEDEPEYDGKTDEDEIPDAYAEAVTQMGEIWCLGNHRLMCGDSTDGDQVALLLCGQKVDLAHNDPPYGLGETGDRTKRGKGLAPRQKLNDFDDSSADQARKAFALCEKMGIPRQVWWGANHYAHTLPETANWFVWDKRVEEKQKDTQSDCELAWVKSKWASVRIFRHLWKGLIKASEKNEKRVHPTQKPVALVEWVFEYYKDLKTVLDLFGGSGSTLIAAEKKGLTSFTMEIEPCFVDVIIRRWQNFTGLEATELASGDTFNEIAGRRGIK